jgi:hypothetical protein
VDHGRHAGKQLSLRCSHAKGRCHHALARHLLSVRLDGRVQTGPSGNTQFDKLS